MNRYLLDNLTDQETEALEKLKSSLMGFLGARLVKFVLYGSKARGDYNQESDIDIAIVVKELTRELKNQILDKVVGIEFEYLTPLSTFVLSEEEFEYLRTRERRIALDIEKEGIPLGQKKIKKKILRMNLIGHQKQWMLLFFYSKMVS